MKQATSLTLLYRKKIRIAKIWQSFYIIVLLVTDWRLFSPPENITSLYNFSSSIEREINHREAGNSAYATIQ